jgi:hypothetical protein
MMICVNSDLLGTRQHLVYQVNDGGEYYWSEKVPAGAWIFGDYGSLRSLDVVFDLLGIEKPTITAQPHVRSFKLLTNGNYPKIPWHQVLPPHKFKQLITCLVTGLENALVGFASTNYMETFIAKRALLTRLSRVTVDHSLLASYIRNEKNATVRGTLKSFLPETHSLARPIMYNQTGTVTGRLTVNKGPQILTLPKKYRDIMISRYSGGSIVQIDFTSLEPRVARLAAGFEAENDVYLQLSRELFNSALKREEVKIAVLCALYGVSKRRLASMLGKEFQADVVIREIKDFFGISELVKDLRNQMMVNHKIKNHFGRTIESDKADDNILVNHYVQSTAVDAAILGFHRLMIMLEGLAIEPLFVIHDALVLDVSPKAMQGVQNAILNGLDIPTMGAFPVELSVISDVRE